MTTLFSQEKDGNIVPGKLLETKIIAAVLDGLALQNEEMRALLRRIASMPCDHGTQEFCPRLEAKTILDRLERPS